MSVYLEEVVVFSKPVKEHIAHLEEVLRVIAASGLKLKVAKCSFAQSQTRLLGYIVSGDGVKVDPEKISAIK